MPEQLIKKPLEEEVISKLSSCYKDSVYLLLFSIRIDAHE